ncbi:hypothetical protein GGS20DRAFT_563066 [Poronia punctata]|nr:hypothetical protein GGS20DRAFT_563066 [Poronia punctata]
MPIINRLVAGLAATTINFDVEPRAGIDKRNCRVLPGDSAWPSPQKWAKLNQTVHGHLIASVPIGSVCHNVPFQNYDVDTCSVVQNTWDKTTWDNLGSPPNILSSYWKNYTCDPFGPSDAPCKLGNLPSYVIDVTGAADVQAGIKFAKDNNVRLVIKNTGHDYLGKSSGKGGLSLWTHNLKSTQYIPKYSSSHYKGPAIKLGAGIEGFAAYAAAHATGHRIVGGTCPTVGIAGGYSQGGGHSLLNSAHGMAADNVLEWEVVTMDGKHLVATPEKNKDLYWAMSGGGGGTYAVALSMTTRLHVDSVMGGAALSFNDSKVGNDVFWEAMEEFLTLLPAFVDAGNTFAYLFSETYFQTISATMPGSNLKQVDKWMKPFLDSLTRHGIDYKYVPTEYPSFYEHFDRYLGPLPLGSTPYGDFVSSRIIPRANIMDRKQLPKVTDALRKTARPEGWYDAECVALNAKALAKKHPDNAVNPAWRDALLICLFPGRFDPQATPAQMQARLDYGANVVQPTIDKATPGGAVYMNEALWKQQNWQKEFYGANYKRLVSIKKKYDPQGLLYARTAVGSDAWVETDDQRLCKA